MLIWRVLGYCSKHKMWRQFEIIRIANKIMIQQKMDQIITHKPKGSVDISVYLAWTNISGFMISSQEHWLPGGGGKGLCDPSSPSPVPPVWLLQGLGRSIWCQTRDKGFFSSCSPWFFYHFDEKKLYAKVKKAKSPKHKPAHLSLTAFQTYSAQLSC